MREFFLCVLLWIATSLAASAQEQIVANTDLNESFRIVKDGKCHRTSLAEKSQCKIISVPETRSNPDSGVLDIYVHILKATGDSQLPDPIVFLDGGPGSSSKGVIDQLGDHDDLRKNRDIIIVFQRGSAKSSSALCPETSQIYNNTYQKNITIDETATEIAVSLANCFENLANAGRDIGGYTTVENAHDLRDIRRALGIDQWNIWGVSYGTALAQVLMTIDGEAIRSVLLDGVVLTTGAWSTDTPANTARTLDLIGKLCTADRRCAKAYPDLNQLFEDAIGTLSANPMRYALPKEIRDSEKNTVDEFVLNAHDLSQLTFSSLYQTRKFTQIPLLLKAVVARDTLLTAQILDASFNFNSEEGLDFGAYFAMGCRFPDASPTVTTKYTAHNLTDDGYFRQICDTIGIKSEPPVTLKSDFASVPVLLISGKFDPVTPPVYAEQLASQLSNVKTITFGGATHGPSLDYCGQIIAEAFFAHPNEVPDSFCTEFIRTFKFPTKFFPADDAEKFNADFDLGLDYAFSDTTSLFVLIAILIFTHIAFFQYYKSDSLRLFAWGCALLTTVSYGFIVWMIASTHYSESVYYDVYSAGIGFVPFGSEKIIWAVPIMILGGMVMLITAGLTLFRKSIPGLSSTLAIAGLCITWAALLAISSGVFPQSLTPIFDPIANNDFVEELLHD